jgi:hypothetical protein
MPAHEKSHNPLYEMGSTWLIEASVLTAVLPAVDQAVTGKLHVGAIAGFAAFSLISFLVSVYLQKKET